MLYLIYMLYFLFYIHSCIHYVCAQGRVQINSVDNFGWTSLIQAAHVGA